MLDVKNRTNSYILSLQGSQAKSLQSNNDKKNNKILYSYAIVLPFLDFTRRRWLNPNEFIAVEQTQRIKSRFQLDELVSK